MSHTISSKCFNINGNELFISQYQLDQMDVSGNFSIKSEKTQNVVEFEYLNSVYNLDMDLLFTRYVPTPQEIDKNPKLQSILVYVTNT